MKTQCHQTIGATAVKLGASRQVVIPKKLHDRLGLKPGDYLEVAEHHGKVVLTPKTLVDKELDRRISQSMDDFKNGRYSGPFDTADEAIESLHKAARARRAKKATRR